MYAGASRAMNSNSLIAVQIVFSEDGREAMGPLTQLPKTSDLEACGAGFDERTIRVRFQGSDYYVFREDLQTVPVAVVGIRKPLPDLSL
jgi:hypothetical protein